MSKLIAEPDTTKLLQRQAEVQTIERLVKLPYLLVERQAENE